MGSENFADVIYVWSLVQVGVAGLVAEGGADVLVLGRQASDPVRVQHVLAEFL